MRGLLDPARWFSSHGRTEMAVDYYQQVLFGQATFADLLKRDGPLILINSSDLGHGVRFSFVQEYFNLLCSDLASFPLARAVTASSAVPVIFDPVVVENFSGCSKTMPQWLLEARQRLPDNADVRLAVDDDAVLWRQEPRTAMPTSSMAASPTTWGCARCSNRSRWWAARRPI